MAWAKCELTGRSFKNEKLITVWYTPTRGQMFSVKALEKYTDKQIINYTKQIIQPTLEDLEDLKNNPKFKMWIDKKQSKRIKIKCKGKPR